MKKYVIERDLPGVGGMSDDELGGATSKSNEALAQLAEEPPPAGATRPSENHYRPDHGAIVRGAASRFIRRAGSGPDP